MVSVVCFSVLFCASILVTEMDVVMEGAIVSVEGLFADCEGGVTLSSIQSSRQLGGQDQQAGPG